MNNLEILYEALDRMPAKDVAELLEVKPAAISMWRHRKQPFPAVHALYLAEKLGMEAPNIYDMLADGTEHRSRKEWLRKKAHAASVSALAIASVFAVLCSVDAQNYSLFPIGLETAFHMLPTIYYTQYRIDWRWRRIAPASVSLMENERMGLWDRCVVAGFAFAISMSVAGALMSLLWLIVLVARHERGLHLLSEQHWIDSGHLCTRGFPVMGAASRSSREARPGA